MSYKFRYRAKNIYGWGEYSDEAVIVPSQKPDRPDPVACLLVSTNVMLQWQEPEDYGTAIESYDVQFLTHDGVSMSSDDTYCVQVNDL